CLRVEETDTSIELLRRPDAAYLPNGLPGRGYLQIGNDNAELIQVSWTGESQADDRAAAVLWPDHTSDDSALVAEDIPKFYDAVVMLAQEMNHGQMAPRVWPAFLPNKYSLQSAIYDAQRNESYILMPVVSDWLNGDVNELWRGVDWHENAMQPVVGLIDDPLEARQYPLEFTLSRNHLAVFGDTGWGKTSLLRTIMVSLATTHSPDELHIYILDLGGRNFTTVAQLPHVGAMISSDEEEYEERLMRLLDRLETIVAERQRLFGDAGVGTLRDYNSQFPDKRLPAVLVIIDNFADLRESYEILVESTVTPLIRRSLSAGISFVISANTHTEIPSKVYNLLGERITLMQADAERYMDIVGRGTVELDEVAGRGYIRRDGRPLQFQAALPVGVFDPEDGHDTRTEVDELRRLATQMKSRGGWQHDPLRIDTLPTLVSLRAMLPADLPESGKPNVTAILGMNSALRPASFDLRRTGPHFVVTGPPLSGKTTTLYTWIISMARRYPPTQVMFVLIDLQARFADYGGNQNLQALPHTVAYITDAEELPGLTQQLDNECQVLSTASNNRKIYIVVDNFDDLGEELLSSRDNDVRDAGNALVRIARRMGPNGVHFVTAGSFATTSDLGRIVRASNFGIGLRTGDSLNALNVNTVPANIRDREFNIGRGFVARSGQISMLQVATPYQDDGHIDVDESIEEAETRAVAALDQWVSEISAQWQAYPAATWSAPIEVENEEAGEGAATSKLVQSESKEVRQLKTLLQKAMRWELTVIQNGHAPTENGAVDESSTNGNGSTDEFDSEFDGEPPTPFDPTPTVTLAWLGMTPAEQNNENKLFRLCQSALIKRLQAENYPDPELFVNLFNDVENLMMTAEGYFDDDDTADEGADDDEMNNGTGDDSSDNQAAFGEASNAAYASEVN
ncbi:MAG TPA: FtsK/SpoIIIE domain-containing protein, partial [Caldilineaceae bacterium]|nr:FtsK/SpoIIIE domain-containing protein [Caldilineaceae bacterium]